MLRNKNKTFIGTKQFFLTNKNNKQMELINRNVRNIQANPLAFLGGGIAGYYATSKFINADNMWYKLGGALLGGVIVTMVASSMQGTKAQMDTKAIIVKK
jgi:hypothetical protein